MLTTFEDVVILFLSVLFSLVLLGGLQYFWPGSRRLVHNDIVGWHLSVLGTTYAVIIGFMLYAVWSAYQNAEVTADNEANSLVNVYRLADGLPDQQRVNVHRLAREYADAVVEQEWQAMHEGRQSVEAHPIIEELWGTLVQAKPTTFSEQTSVSLTLTELSNMTRFRRARHLEDESKLPTILWIVMIFGGFLTVLFASLFGAENFKLHAIQVVALTMLISLILIAIGDIDRPFRGSVHVQPLGLERALETFGPLPAANH